MAILPFMFICLCLSFVNCEVQTTDNSNNFQNYQNEITAVLNYLNSLSFKVYNYKEATLLYAHKKADITELTLDINVECINKYPNVPCNEKVIVCHAFVQSKPQGDSQVLNDVSCKQKPEIVIDESADELFEDNVNEPKTADLSYEAVSSEVSEPFVAIRKNSVPCLGCPFDLNLNANGVDELVDLALEHVTSERSNKHALIKVLKLQQQIVSGVKYILTVELGPTICPKNINTDSSACPLDPNSKSLICQITYLQKPWISKAKHIINNNCTVSQEYVKADSSKTDLSNEIDFNERKTETADTTFDKIAQNGAAEEMTPARLSDLESQIISVLEEPKASDALMSSTVNSQMQIQPVVEYGDQTATEITVPIDQTTGADVTETINPEIEDVGKIGVVEKESTTEGLVETTRQPDSFEEKNSSQNNNNISEEQSTIREKRAIPQLQKISPEEKNLVKNLADFAASALDDIDDDNQKRIILQILGAKKMVGDDGVYYHLIMRMGVSRCLEDKSYPYENCREKLLENYTKICKVQVYVNDDFASPKIVKSQCQNIKRDKNDNNRTNYARYKRDFKAGGENNIDKNDENVKKLIEEGITHFNYKLETTNKYKPVEVLSATSQVVAGALYKIELKIAESECLKHDEKKLEDCNIRDGAAPKKCQLEVWEKKWENFRRFKISCDGHHEINVDTKINRKKRAVSNSGNIHVEELLYEAMKHFNSKVAAVNKYKLVEFEVEVEPNIDGAFYKIRSKIAESDCAKDYIKDLANCKVREGATPKKCYIEINEIALLGFRGYNISCDGYDKVNFETKISREKREVLEGGLNDIDKNDKKVKELLHEGINHFNSKTEASNKYKPVEVVSATSQVVAGALYRIDLKVAESDCAKDDKKDLDDCNIREGASLKKCHLKVWEKGWENFRQFQISCDGHDEIKLETKISRKKRDVLVGGHNSIDKNDKKVQDLLHEGINHFNSKIGAVNKYKPVEVVSATSQVVAGALYRIDLKIAESDCAKDDKKDLENCNVRDGATPKNCYLNVWEKTWENFRQFKISCDGHDEIKVETKISRKKRSIPGGLNPIDKNSEKVKLLLNEGVTHLSTGLQTTKKVKPVEILSASSQVVAGVLYRIDAKIAESDCLKTEEKNLNECNVPEGAEAKKCQVKVWEKKWENFKQFTITCEGDDKEYKFESKITREKRHLGARELPVDKNDEHLIKHLENALTQLDNESNFDNKYKIEEIVSATSQLIAGEIYRIKAKIALSSCKKTEYKRRSDCDLLENSESRICNFVIFEQAWVPDSRVTNITCDNDEVYFFKDKKGIDIGDDKFLRKSLQIGLRQLDSRFHYNNKFKLYEVLSVIKENVPGHFYKVKAKVILSDCDKKTKKKNCGNLEGAEPKICDFTIFEARYVPKSLTVDADCSQDDVAFNLFTDILTDDDKIELFENFLRKYQKKYSQKELEYRYSIFRQNLVRIKALNTFEQGTATYGVTQFADLTEEEFSKNLGLRMDLRNENEPPFAEAIIPNVELPKEFDWRKKGIVTKVKNQEQCGSCWAFSVTGNVEGQFALKHGKLLEFSEQELVDCDKEDQGCNGGLMDTAYRQIEKLGGLETEQDYPYDAEDEKCHFNKTLVRVQLSGAVNISHDETDMAKWLTNNGPISIAINANAMQFYFGGISHPLKFLCSPKNLDHGVLIVGYGVHTYPLFNKTLPYWIIKNSWGTSWGEQGYYRVYRGDGTCGLNETPSSAIVV